MSAEQLPISALIPAVLQQLPQSRLVLEAPPGAGKSTALPLALLGAQAWQGQRILLLQPRRIAALSIARYLAAQLGEPVGQQVGYHVRGDQQLSASTRLVVLTEGMFTQYLQRDPELAGVGLVIFDEFHERNLASDLGLAMLLESLQLRPDLSLLVMSATLPASAIAAWLGDATVLTTAGRSYPVSIEYRPPAAHSPWLSQMPAVIHEGLRLAKQGVLVFLPGQAEIEQLSALLGELSGVTLLPLYSQLPLAQQQLVLEPPRADEKRLILATNIAETSLTIPAIDVVIDSGRERLAQFYPQHGISRLITRRISKASATQRAGRAGRLQAGHCLRLWASAEQAGLRDYQAAELETADLSDFLLECRRWGSEPQALRFYSPPNQAHLAAAHDLLQVLAICHAQGNLTSLGQQLAEFAGDVRLARIALWAKQQNPVVRAGMALLLAQLEQNNIDANRFPLPPQQLSGLLKQRWQYWLRALQAQASEVDLQQLPMVDLLWGFADRIAQRRGSSSRYLLSYGGGARFHDLHTQAHSEWLLVLSLSLQEHQPDAIIRLAIPLSEADLKHPAIARIEEQQIELVGPQQRLQVVERERIGAIVIRQQPSQKPLSTVLRVQAWINLSRQQGIELWQWSAAAQQWLARVRLMARLHAAQWPDFSATVLLQQLEHWATPYWQTIATAEQLRQWSPLAALQARLSYAQQQQLDSECPSHWQAPSGRTHSIDYSQAQPLVAVKLQEVFGEPVSPTIVQGQVTLTIDLLSPAGRLLQRTSDLASFWRNAYQQVKKEMRGRYPKHPWPDDPLQARASHLTKRHLD
jgi:ATP-dependent helicase HrpB